MTLILKLHVILLNYFFAFETETNESSLKYSFFLPSHKFSWFLTTLFSVAKIKT